VVSSAQNAAEILKGLNDALYEELKRARMDRDEHERRADRCEVLLRQNGIPIPQDEPRTQAQA
jgi:hypothetical protein